MHQRGDPYKEAQPPLAAGHTAKRLTPYVPFPVHCLPGVAGEYVAAAAEAIGCDPAFISLPLVAALGSSIGNARRVLLKRGWVEPPVIWAATVGDSGSMKSPAFELGVRPIYKRQARLFREHRRTVAAHLEEVAGRKAMPKKDRGETPEPLDPAPVERILCDDITAEALADRLQSSPRGILVAVDELAGWFSSFDQYKAKGRGGDVARWLSMHKAGSLLVDRKTGDVKTIHIPAAFVSVAGTIQPATLRRKLTPEFYENGAAARLLLAYPPRQQKKWSDAEVDGPTESRLVDLFESLFQLQPETATDGTTQPTNVPLDVIAREHWAAFVNQVGAEQFGRTAANVIASWSKLEGYAARFALIIHQVRHAIGDVLDAFRIDSETIAAGIELARWFGDEAERVYALLAESDEERATRELVEMIRANGGKMSGRELQHRRFAVKTAAAAEAILEKLVVAGMGGWHWPTPKRQGGRPAKIFVLSEIPASDFEQEERAAVAEFGGG